MTIVATNGDDEIERLRAARLAELQSQIEEQASAQMIAEEQEQLAAAEISKLNEAMKVILTPEARSRLARLEMGYPELTFSVKQQLYTLHATSRIAIPVSDLQLRNILSSLQEEKRESTIRRL